MQPTTTTTFQPLCLTDSSYGDMAATELDSDTDDVARPHYVDGDALEAVVTPRSHVYSSLRLCNSKHSSIRTYETYFICESYARTATLFWRTFFLRETYAVILLLSHCIITAL